MAPTNSLEDLSNNLLKTLTAGLDNQLGIGSFSSAIYDTAWVAMVEKVDQRTGEKQALFPECFQFLLDTQLPGGAWEAYSCDIDGILNTMAALIALKRRSTSINTNNAELGARCVRAQKALQELMELWDIRSCDRVGFEIIVPALLRLLQEVGVEIKFPARDVLMQLCDEKMAKLYPLLYEGPQSTLTHSLEAFVGKLNYDKVKHHASPYGAMLASPSSTAAYLLYSKEWDHRAESYLRQVVEIRGKNGGIPSAFPTTIFELSWITATLIDAGFTPEQLGEFSLSKVREIISDNLTRQNGIVGFAPYCLPDADDSSMAISVLGLLGEHVPLTSLCAQYETPSHFLTYRGERNASFSANCNVLLCLLRRSDLRENTLRVVKCTQFLSQLWYEGKVKDKWNTSEYYPMMLLAKAFVMLLSRWEKGDLKEQDLPTGLISERVPVVLMDILIRTLDRQLPNGSWDSMNEITSYALITLASLFRLPWFQSIETEIADRIWKAREFLERNRSNWSHGKYLWIEKVAYSSSNLSKTYCIAAMKATESGQPKEPLGAKVDGLLQAPAKTTKAMVKFFSKIPMFLQTPEWKLNVVVNQALLFVPALHRVRLEIFPRKSVGKDKYLQYIPFTWVSVGNGSLNLSLDVQWEMMVLSMLIYQVDEFMEAYVAHEITDNLNAVRSIVRHHCQYPLEKGARKRPREEWLDDHDSALNAHTNSSSNGSSYHSLQEVDRVLGNFIKTITTQPKVTKSAPWLQQWLSREIEAFLLAHVDHISDCHSLANQHTGTDKSLVFRTARSTYFDWVRTTTADTTGGPFAFPFYICLLDVPDKNRMSNIVARYISQDVSRHLATLCRQHNDVGSLSRDLFEKNLNSVNFFEFNTESNYASSTESPPDHWKDNVKKELLEVAEYERSCLDKALFDFETLAGTKMGGLVRVFVDVTDLYGQLYLAKDISASNLNRQG
ncbi:Ent-kaurene synthase [Corynespora cassiicola Philippines]|uniref:Ent-kaurene synthase n=1 Tax=Corynespora cassiicola Philippines TaxID=1448308 RepID=A0A2T2ND67_CORCC|nr:Ent-kaurene synthase [Corynespora cassiicola Philippines]